MNKKYTYDYPRPMVTVDIFLSRFFNNEIQILLIQRKKPPFKNKWAFPGGFIDINEKLEDSAHRELFEETGYHNIILLPLISAGNPGRDPRGRTITQVFFGIQKSIHEKPVAGDDASNAKWFPLNKLPELAFDHAQLINQSLEDLKIKLLWQLWILFFLPDEFSPSDLSSLCQIIFDNNQISLKILKISSILKLIESSSENKFRKCVTDGEIYQIAPNRLIEIWGKI
jgi:8-oxo-dGTP diphosphatase